MVSNDQFRTTGPSSWVDPVALVTAEPRWRRALPLVVWVTCLGVAVALLFALGDGRLAAPPLTDPGAWQAWAAGRDPLEVVMVVLRLVALAVAWYLAGVTSISVIARVLRAARLARVADALSVGPVKVLVQQAVGVSLAAGVVASSVPGAAVPGRAAASADRVEVAVMAVERQGGEADQRHTGGDTDASRAVMIPVPAPVPADRPSPSPSPIVPAATAPSKATATPAPAATTTAPAPTITRPSPTAAPPAREVVGPSPKADAPRIAAATPATAGTPTVARGTSLEVRVRAGDHFWGLAEQAVADHLGRPGSEEEVLAHWEAMLLANVDRLVVAGNPDLLLPGQAVVVPDVAQVLP